MNAEQKARILAVIERDAAVRGRYVNMKGEFCVIGGLMDDAKVDVASLYRTGENTRGVSQWFRFTPLLEETFGLSLIHLRELQHINDRTANHAKRRQALTDYVNTIDVKE